MINEFLQWEQVSRDTIDVKRIYIDVAGDLVAGILLSQIVFWNLPNKAGRSKLRVNKKGVLWLAKGRGDWWEECRISPKQFDRAIKILRDKGLVRTQLFKFDGSPTTHIHLNTGQLVEEIKWLLPKGENGFLPLGKFEVDQRLNSLTETTTETTTDIYYIFDHWNSKEIIIHKKLTEQIKRSINAKLKDFTVPEVVEAIDNYATILNGKQYFWTHKWTLMEFLKRANGFEKFLSINKPFENFKAKTYGVSQAVDSPRPYQTTSEGMTELERRLGK